MLKVVLPRSVKAIFILCTLYFVLCTSISPAQFYRGYQMNFGKNRVQYTEFLWTYYRFKNFDTYFYLGGKEIAAYVGKTGDEDIAEIEKLFDYRSESRLQFIVYNKLSDLKQSNIGLEGDEQFSNTGGLTKIYGNKILLYFDGNRQHLREQMRAGIAKVMLDQLMFGGNVRDRLQSALLLNLPEWYVNGLISYVSQRWNTELDNRMRDEVETGKLKSFKKLMERDPTFAGHTMWNFISESYGDASISNLVYMTRMNRNIESGFEYVVGLSLRQLSDEWIQYYRKLYLDSDKNRQFPEGTPVVKKPRSTRLYTQLRVSPDGNKIAYVTNEIGKYKVFIYDVSRNKRKCIAKGGYKSLNFKTDDSYPVLLWHPSGSYLTMFIESKGKIWMDYYMMSNRKRERNKFFYFEKVMDASYSNDGLDIVLSATQKGQSDIFVYNVRTRTHQQITHDFFDDLTPHFSEKSRFIIFSSNRFDDTLRTEKERKFDVANHYDLFLYDNENRSDKLIRVTNTPLADETQPLVLDSSHFVYLSDESGIYNSYSVKLDSTISFIDTTEHYRYVVETKPLSNNARSVSQHDISYRKSKYADVIYNGGKTRMYVRPATALTYTGAAPSPANWQRQTFKADPGKKEENPSSVQIIKFGEEDKNKVPQIDTGKIDIYNYTFQSEFPNAKRKTPARNENFKSMVTQTVTGGDTSDFLLPKQRNYDISFTSDYFLTQLDNSLYNATYQAFVGGGGGYYDPGLNGLFLVGINDLFNDYKLTGGFRLAGNLNSNEYFASYENLKSRWDKEIAFYKTAREEYNGFTYAKIHTHEVKYIVKYPFSDLAAVRGSIALRTDRLVFLSTDIFNLKEPDQHLYYTNSKLEYIYDNTINRGLNLYNGTRLKFFGEYYKQLDEKKTNTFILGVDVRNYLKLHRQIILASRFATSTSFGDLRLIYYLGSQDNAIVPTDNFNYDTPIDYNQNYVFQTLATNMRGFKQNIRNGNNFAVVNEELRIPIFQYLINKPIRSDFIRNFQLIGFGDIGTAWTGTSPYSENNSFNTVTIVKNPFVITVKRQVEPIVYGYGFGMRSRLLGYFIRADWAWGVEDKTVQPYIFYLSLGLDF